MVQLACSCLNIRLHVQETADALVAGVPNLTSEESQHPFFVKVGIDSYLCHLLSLSIILRP